MAKLITLPKSLGPFIGHIILSLILLSNNIPNKNEYDNTAMSKNSKS